MVSNKILRENSSRYVSGAVYWFATEVRFYFDLSTYSPLQRRSPSRPLLKNSADADFGNHISDFELTENKMW